MQSFYGIIPAAGSGQRLGSQIPKQFLTIAGKPMVDYAIQALFADERIEQVHVIVAPDDANRQQLPTLGATLDKQIQEKIFIHDCGGMTRVQTVASAVNLFAGQDVWLAVHDAARPCLHADDLSRIIDVVEKKQTPALLAEPVAATLKQGKGNIAVQTIDRTDKWLALTPQIALADQLCEAFADLPEVTDEAEALEKIGINCQLVQALHVNPKITTKADFVIAESVLTSSMSSDK